jgi:hypothetical protein
VREPVKRGIWQEKTMNKQNMTIGLLAAAAVVLAILVMFVGRADQAVAGNVQSVGGDFVGMPLSIRNEREVLVLVDNSAERLNIYGMTDQGQLELAPSLSIRLDQYFEQMRAPAQGR